MKTITSIYSFLTILVLLLGCNQVTHESSKELDDSLKSVKLKEDSLFKIYRDSLQAVSDAKLAYENRPWKIGEYSDQFGDPTGEKFISTNTIGNFSNSATSNSDLWVKIIIEKSIAGLFLHQYSPSDQAEKFIGNGKMFLKNEKGEKIEILIGGHWNQNGGIRIENNNFTKLISFLKKSPGEIIVVVHNEYSSIYNFSIKGDGFNDEFKLLSKK